MFHIDDDTIERARKAARKRLDEYMELVEKDRPSKERRAAWDAYKEASDVWKGLLRSRYRL